MGTRNRQRRAEKQRRRAHAASERRGPRVEAGGPSIPELLLAAASAHLAADAASTARVVGLLEEAPRHAVAAELARMLSEAIAGAWRRGWQPADLARVMERKAGVPQGRFVVDVIALDARRYLNGQVDERWADQLSGVDATVWWPEGEPHLDQWATREGVPWAEALSVGIEVLTVLLHLVSLPRLCDPPGERRDSGPVASTRRRPHDPRMLDRVRALLAKAESTNFPEEAEALTMKAQELMARHSLDEAMVGAAEGTASGTIGVRLAVDDPYASAKSMLLSEVAAANGCRTVWSKGLGFSTVFGFDADVAFVEVLYTSLLVQATAAMVAAGSQADRSGRSRTRSFRQSFLVAFAGRIGDRLREAEEAGRQSAAGEYGDALLPVLAGRSAAVDEAVQSAFPRLGTNRVSINNAAGWAAGSAAAELASLSARTEVARPA
jgi:hypothetical protein